jgi:hypothetical protein
MEGLSPDAGNYLPLINQVSGTTGVPSSILAALVQQESSYNPNAVGSSGEIGLTQISPSLAQSMGLSSSQLLDPLTNLQAGASYLASLFGKFGNWSQALQAYNAGPGAVNSGSSAGQGYASSVLNLAGSLSPNMLAAMGGTQISPSQVQAQGISNMTPSSTSSAPASGLSIPGAPAWVNSLLNGGAQFAIPAVAIIAGGGLIVWAVLSLFKTNDGSSATIIKEVSEHAPEAAAAA